MLGDADAPFSPPSAIGASVALHVYVPDVDALTAQAVAAGAELLTPPTDMSYGARQSMLRDPFGHIWIFLTPIAPRCLRRAGVRRRAWAKSDGHFGPADLGSIGRARLS